MRKIKSEIVAVLLLSAYSSLVWAAPLRGPNTDYRPGCLPVYLPKAGAVNVQDDYLARMKRLAVDLFADKSIQEAVHLNESGDTNPLEGRPLLFLDSNVIIKLEKLVYSPNDLSLADKEGLSRVGAWLEKLGKGASIAVPPQVLREIHPYRNTPSLLNVVAIGPENVRDLYENAQYREVYEDLLQLFFRLGLGTKDGVPDSEADGIKDRRIIAQLFFTQPESKGPLRLVTQDKGIFRALFQLGLIKDTLRDLEGNKALSLPKGIVSTQNRELYAKLIRAETIQLFYPDGFEVSILVGKEMRPLQILPMPSHPQAKLYAKIFVDHSELRELAQKERENYYEWILTLVRTAKNKGFKTTVDKYRNIPKGEMILEASGDMDSLLLNKYPVRIKREQFEKILIKSLFELGSITLSQ